MCVVGTMVAIGSAQAYTTIGIGDFSGSAVTIDFEDYPVGTQITDEYKSKGVVFSSYNGVGLPQIDNNEAGGGQGLNGGPGDPTIYTNICQDAGLWIDFVHAATGDPGATAAGGFHYIDVEPYIGRAFFYDIEGTLIYTFVLDEEIDFWGLKADPGDLAIGRILVDSSGYDNIFGPDVSESYTIDNLTFEPVQPINVVPAPAAVLMAGLGTGLVGWLRKRKAL